METTLLGDDTFSAVELAEAAGLTYRRLDYYTRVGLLIPSVARGVGHGSRRRYDRNDLARARLIRELMDHGADIPTVACALANLAPDPTDWPTYFFVTRNGTVKRGLPLPPACWAVSTAPLLELPDSIASAA